MEQQFVIDGVCHPYNFSEENLRGRFERIFNDVLFSFYPPTDRPDTMLTKDEWQHNWQNDEFLESMLLESDMDMVCVHSIPLYGAYHDGLVTIEKGTDLKRRYPERVIWYGTADIMQGQKALQELEYQVTELGAEGIKLYPAQYYQGRTRFWRMDDYGVAFPVFELAMKLGVRNVAIHKALPLGPVSTESMRVDDIGQAAAAFPEINFQIVHAGFMFLDECKMLVCNHPNVYATLETTFFFCMVNPQAFATVLGELLSFGGPEKIIYSSAAMASHPRYLLEAFEEFQMPAGFPIQLTDEVRSLILGGNLVRLHGIDLEERRRELQNDAFSKEKSANCLREPWSTRRREVPA